MREPRSTTRPQAGDPSTKTCPMCAETIKEEARVCHFCGAQFAVTWQGYCGTCHAVVDLGPERTCSRCQGEVIDERCTSELVSPGVPTRGVPAPAAAVPDVAPPSEVAPPVVRGDLRGGYIGSARQRVAEAVLGVAVALSMVTTLLGFGGEDTFLFGLKPGISEARPGIWFFVVPLIAVLVGVRHLGPRGWANVTYRLRLRERYGIRVLYKKSGVYVRVAIATALWALSLILAIWFVSRMGAGYDIKPGAYLIIGSSIVGLLVTPLILPGRDNKEVRVDDAGELFQ